MGGERMKTISLEFAKELQQICKEKGITMPESFQAWRMNSNVYMSGKREYFLYLNFAYQHPELTPPEPEKVDGIKIIRAYTLDELLEWLPDEIVRKEYVTSYYDEPERMELRDISYELILHKKEDNLYRAIYTQSLNEYDEDLNDDEAEEQGFLKLFDDTNPANAACKLLIWLIKKGLI